MMQKAILIFVVVLAATCEGLLKPGLKVKFGMAFNPSASKSIFFELPLNVSSAEEMGWSLTPRTSGHLPQLTMYCSPDRYLCTYYDDLKNVAGLQVALPIDKVKKNVYDWETRGFTLWETEVEGQSVSMYAIQQFFVSEESLKKSKEERLRTRDPTRLLQEKAIWYNGVGGLRKVSTIEKDIEAEGVFLKEACISSMGQHWYYNMSRTTPNNAENFYPWFPMTHEGELLATGFLTAGTMATERSARDWFERPNWLAVKFIVPRGPKWLYDLTSKPGLITMHIYYTSTPWLISC